MNPSNHALAQVTSPEASTTKSPSDQLSNSSPIGEETWTQALFDDGINGSLFAWSIGFLEKRGREMFGPHFHIAPRDHPVIFRLLVYFLRQQKEATEWGIDLRKGIALTGEVGCGKTHLFTLMRTIALPGHHFDVKNCRDINFEFSTDGFDVVQRYSTLSYTATGPQALCFDDLGAEQSLKHYGSECAVLGEILLSRHQLYFSAGMITHITTNFGADDLETMYGNRVRSRMRELFNWITFDSSDKRT